MSKYPMKPGQRFQINFQGGGNVVSIYRGSKPIGVSAANFQAANAVYHDINTQEYTFNNCVLFAASYDGNGTPTIFYKLDKTDTFGNRWYYDGRYYRIGTIALDMDGRWFRNSNAIVYLINGIRTLSETNAEQYCINVCAAGHADNVYFNGVNHNGQTYPNGNHSNASTLFNVLSGGALLKCKYYFTGQTLPSTAPLYYPWLAEGVNIESILGTVDPYDEDPNAQKWGNSTPGGGKGTRPGDSGKIVNPYAPDVDVLDAGFLTAFLPTASQLNDLAAYLWSNPISFESLEKLVSNPFDLIIGLHMLPISIASAGTKAIKPGALTSGISAAYTDKQIVTKDFGTLTIAERWGSVLDYAPYTKVQIHLPYIGTRTLDTDEVMNKTIGLKYKVDILSGACVAEISVDGSVMYEFAGNMALDIPITASDHRQLLATLATIGVAATGAGVAALGGAGGAAAAGVAASDAAGATGITAATVSKVGNAAVGLVMASKPTIERAGGLGSAAGWCGVQTPYILIESPEQSLPKNYMSFNGYPCNMTFTLSQLSGYTQCETVRFGSSHATDPEMQEIIASLQAGVVLGGDAPTKPTDPESGIGVTLYQNASPALYVYKDITAYGAQHVCNFKQPTNIVTPTITLELSAIDFNYVYIGGSVDRYYYVTEKRSVRRGVWEVELKCDPLMSFASDILAANAVVSRQENEWNMYLDDGSFKSYQYTNFYQEPFATSFDTETFVLLVAGS